MGEDPLYMILLILVLFTAIFVTTFAAVGLAALFLSW